MGRMPQGKKAGWLAFILGMAGMFLIMAVWVALVEVGEDPHAEVEFIGRSQPADELSGETTSDYR